MLIAGIIDDGIGYLKKVGLWFGGIVTAQRKNITYTKYPLSVNSL